MQSIEVCFLRTLGAEPTTYGEGMVDRVRQLAPNGVVRASDTAGRGALPGRVRQMRILVRLSRGRDR